ncbi:hypothetical protein SAMN02745704_00572 [Paucidesulfovibrio gracilis DSM 16080]|uniref:DUF401 family protein n=1 Tax=Paucidesulfovibrio gracilis DSM 16080 TaxID=1121449 RepID=A0A1T4W9Y3_9BACT|nr:DUF401 family protein [Paucidesulfovibrio gracilis]SKA74007.1 hypothetical protein SAMN02745704_00572 [Paucidesulfovibrio gracilis DSM 16080]
MLFIRGLLAYRKTMNWLPPSWIPLCNVVLSFVIMLVLVRFRFPLGGAILAGSLALGLLFGMSLPDWGMAVLSAPFEEKPLFLTAIIGLIMALSHLLEKSGQTGRIMHSVSGLIRNPRLRMAFFASLIGLLPMPGGAIFSAPLVRGAAQDLDVSPDRLALINYWFRHVWELAWPLYPGVILAAALAGLPISSLLSLTFPGLLLSLLLGCWFFLRPGVLPLERRADAPEATPPGPVSWSAIAREGLPLLVAIFGAVGLEVVIGVLQLPIPFELGMCAALALAIAVGVVQNTGGGRLLFQALTGRPFLSMLFVIVGIFGYQEVLRAAGAVERIAELTGGGAALAFTAGLLPLLVGTVTGITLAYVGSTFPLILGMAANTGTDPLACVVLGMFAGYAGIMASPLHICLVLTCQYFGTDITRVWRRLLLPSVLLLVAGYVYFFLLL